tara:strand:+ start:1021 stop:1782 length:762 start_codon:yes stop_codon:yes gene_type:complete
MILNEGGNVFKADDGEPTTQRIQQADVDTTLKWIESITGMDHVNMKLGSTGIKSSSGDLDVAVDKDKYDKTEVEKKLMQWVIKNHPDDKPRQWVAKSGINVHFKAPINGKEENGFVQLDLMFGEPDFMKFALKGYGDDTKYKGVHRAILISSVAKFHGYKFNSQTGLVDRINNKTVSKDPDEIAQYLLGDSAKGADLDSVDSIVAKIKSDPNYEAMTADAVKYFEKDGLKLPEAVQYEGREWFRNTLDKLYEV